MNRLLRALLWSVLATSVFAWVLRRLLPGTRPVMTVPAEIEADRLSPEEQERLLEELERLL